MYLIVNHHTVEVEKNIQMFPLKNYLVFVYGKSKDFKKITMKRDVVMPNLLSYLGTV